MAATHCARSAARRYPPPRPPTPHRPVEVRKDEFSATSATDPGHVQTSYSIYLEPGNYLSWALYAPNGLTLGTWDTHSTQGFGYVPSRSMNLYVGIWDIGSIGINVDPPGSFTGDSWMALSAIQVWTDV